MKIKKRLQVNVALSLLTAFVICLVLFLSLHRINKANYAAKTAGEIMISVLERITFSNDYIRNNTVRAKEQWLAKHEQIGILLKSASENFRDSEDRKNIGVMIGDHESIGKIFSAIVANRDKSGLNRGSAELSREVEGRLLNQLNMRIYDEVVTGRKLLESSREARASALRVAGWGVISALLLLIAAALINSWTLGRAITARVARLREGAAMVGGGDLEHRIDARGNDEFAELAQSFNAMTAKLSGSYHDLEKEVIERKRAEESLRKAHDELEQRVEERTRELSLSNAYNRSLIEASLDPLVTIGHDGKITDVNDATEAATGLSRAELIGTDFCNYFSEPEKARAGYEQVFAEGSVRDYPLELSHRDGHVTSVLYNASVYSDEGGKVIGVFAAARDITEQKQAGNALRELNNSLEERIIERTAQLNSAIETLRASRVAALNLMEDAVIARRHAEETSDRLRLEIAERKRAEEALEASRLEAVQEKTHLEAVMEALPVGVAILDAEGGHIRANHMFDKLWGGPRPFPRTVDDYAGYKAWWIETGQPVQPEEWASARAVRNDQSLIGQLLRIERFDGAQVYIHNSAAAFHDPDGRIAGCAVAIMDITDQIETQEALGMAKEAAEAASRAKSQFLANMSHELRTPMTGVLGMLEFTLNTTLDNQQRDFIETAHKSARTLLRILNDILDLAKVEAGKLSVEEKPFILGDCVAGAIDILLPEARRKGLELNCTLADDLPKAVIGDQVRLLQVLTNLCGNAVKFTDQGKVAVNVASAGETPGGKREISFTVTDTGIGVAEDKKESIFDSFNQADISHARRYGGTGLGLAISRELVERMGGAISCLSEEGKGSTFSFTIPLGEAATEIEIVSIPVAPPYAPAPVTSAEKRKARLLLAEDDPITRQVVGMMLKHANFDHDIAENGLRAVEMWEKGNYDLILMDVQMPGQDGFAATGAIREKEREQECGGHTIIVAMTAHAFPEDEKRCLAAGMDAYIPKPIDLQKCVEMIGELIGKRDQET